MPGRFDLVIFDCDGVLIDSEPLAVEAVMACLAEQGIALNADEIHEHYTGISMASMLIDIEARHGRTLGEDFLLCHRDRLDALYRERLTAIPGIKAVLDALPGKKCVASSSRPARLDLALSLVGLHRHFAPHIFSATQVARGKPAPDLFLFAAARMGAAPPACLVIEDSTAGVEAAAAAGMAAIGFSGGSHCRPGHAEKLIARGARRVVATMAELLQAIDAVSVHSAPTAE